MVFSSVVRNGEGSSGDFDNDKRERVVTNDLDNGDRVHNSDVKLDHNLGNELRAWRIEFT